MKPKAPARQGLKPPPSGGGAVTLIMSIDAATRTGFCCGAVGMKPRVWSKRLKRPDDPTEKAIGEMGKVLRDNFSLEIPALTIVEAPREMGANIKADKEASRGFVFTTKQETALMLIGLWGAVHAICGPYGCRSVDAKVQTVRAKVLGNGRPHNPKQVAIDWCVDRGYIPQGCKDDNMADAAVLWVYACIIYAGQVTAPMQRFRHDDAPGSLPFTGATRELHLFQESQ